jgi:hypothetical protein
LRSGILASPPLLTCTTQKSSSDLPQNQQERLSSQHRGDEMVATDGCGKSRRKGRECWIDPNGRLTEWDQVSNPVRSRALIGGANRLMIVGPVALRVYKRWNGAGGIDDEVHRDLILSPTSLSGPITKAHRRRESSTLQRYCFGSPALTGSGVVRPPRANAPRIYFHFTD